MPAALTTPPPRFRLLDLAYAIGALALLPIWLPRMIRRGKIRTDWKGRLGLVRPTPEEPGTSGNAFTRSHGQTSQPPGYSTESSVARHETAPSVPLNHPHRPRLLFHAVSVGEVNAIRGLVDELATDHEITIATTTDTGFARAQAIYSGRHAVVRYPFDFTFAVNRFLDAVRPDLVALVELEVWPTFVHQCAARGIPVVVVNGRLSARSFRGYRRIRRLLVPTFARLTRVLAQDQAIAQRFVALGMPADRVDVVGTMKWDNAVIADGVDGAVALREALGIDRGRPLVVGGSTGPDEEALLRAAVPEGCQLLVAPRKPERFDEAAAALAPCRRRSTGEVNGGRGGVDRGQSPPPTAISRFVLDTIGELRAAYALADVVVVGRTFTPLRGSDMIEPIGLGKATIVGPSTDNFESVTRALVEGGGLLRVEADELAATLRRLLDDPEERRRLAERGRAVIRANQGVVARHARAVREITCGTADAGEGAGERENMRAVADASDHRPCPDAGLAASERAVNI